MLLCCNYKLKYQFLYFLITLYNLNFKYTSGFANMDCRFASLGASKIGSGYVETAPVLGYVETPTGMGQSLLMVIIGLLEIHGVRAGEIKATLKWLEIEIICAILLPTPQIH